MTLPYPATVIIPTYGGAIHLHSVLGALSVQTASPFDVIVVDNNLTQRHSDRSVRDVCKFARVIHEPRNGLQHARNKGVTNGVGRYLAFLDDDGIPTPTWLETIVTRMASYQSTAAGGRVNLRLPSASPKWLGACERGLLSELRYDDHDIARLGEDQYIVGANMCIDRDAFTSVGLFDIHFDRTATTLRSSGELEYTRRLQASGRIVSFVAEACVFHQIDPIRLTKRYFYSRSYWQGRSDALLESKWPRPAILGDRDLKVAALELVRYIYALVPERRADARFQYRLALAREFGYILQEMILQFREPTRVSFVS